MKVPLPAERPGCRLGSTQLPFLVMLQPASGPLLTGTCSSLPVALASASTAGKRLPLRAGKAGPLLGAVVVGKDGDFVVGSERALDGAEGVVHLGHHVGGQALVDDKGDRRAAPDRR